MRRLVLCLLLGGPLLAQSESTSLHKFFGETFEERLRDSPEFATNAGHHQYDDRWTDWSPAGREERRRHLEQRLREIKTFALDPLSPEDRLSARLLEYDLDVQLDSFDVRGELFRVLPQGGAHNAIYLTMERMPARTQRDYDNILARLKAVPAYVDQNIALLEAAMRSGVTQPRRIAELVAAQLDAQIAQGREHTPLLAAFRRFPPAIPETERTRLREAAYAAYDDRFLPAWRKYRDFVAGAYAQHGRATAGLGGIPNGQADYRELVRFYTTTNDAPEQIHKLGLAEVERIEKAMQALLREGGFAGSIADYERQLAGAPDQHFHSKEEILVYYRNALKIAEPELPKLFRHIPQLLYGVRAIPPDREAASATNAQPPSPDYTVPGWVNVNTYQPEKQLKYPQDAVALHEGVPGHVMQLTLARALTGLPDFRRFYGNSAYAEGWALYAESLGSQLGLYRDVPARFGQLASERFRAVRLVVDTGLHAMGWTRQQAVDYFTQHAPEESLAEVDRYISWPGQALAYKMGQLKIEQLRAEAERKLGTRFDLREFHDAVLREGILPLDLLQQSVEEWMAEAG
jgi:uncharacterized protein (DUF885 family)